MKKILLIAAVAMMSVACCCKGEKKECCKEGEQKECCKEGECKKECCKDADKKWSPYFEGGIGSNCYYAIAEFLGGKMDWKEGKTWDLHTFKFK